MVQQVVHGPFKRDQGLPPGLCPELCRVAHQGRHVRWTKACGILADGEIDLTERSEGAQDLIYAPTGARTNVVDLSGHSTSCRQEVRTGHVPDIGEVTDRGQIANLELRNSLVCLDFSDLFRKPARNKVIALAWTGVIERTDPDCLQVIGCEVLVAHQVLGHLADRIGICRTKHHLFIDRVFVRTDQPIFKARPYDKQTGCRRVSKDCPDHVQLTNGIV